LYRDASDIIVGEQYLSNMNANARRLSNGYGKSSQDLRRQFICKTMQFGFI
jgi:hypothetical protein